MSSSLQRNLGQRPTPQHKIATPRTNTYTLQTLRTTICSLYKGDTTEKKLDFTDKLFELLLHNPKNGEILMNNHFIQHDGSFPNSGLSDEDHQLINNTTLLLLKCINHFQSKNRLAINDVSLLTKQIEQDQDDHEILLELRKLKDIFKKYILPHITAQSHLYPSTRVEVIKRYLKPEDAVPPPQYVPRK
ncbi:hypothetical protein DID78_04675 [Candidatus Marinamargulisbacteria bacterium SCGC AG-343-D04]|nr:hypothetical protein DID78_04675 [Candidatus Marinamargulisbacteria bacterium SCGC AG-343-D04]